MKKWLLIMVLIGAACTEEEEVSPLNGLWAAEEITQFYFYEYTLELFQIGDSVAVTDHQVIATFRDPTDISWTFVNGRADGDRIYLRFRDGSGFVIFDGLLSGSVFTADKYYGYYYNGVYVEDLRSEVIFQKMN